MSDWIKSLDSFQALARNYDRIFGLDKIEDALGLQILKVFRHRLPGPDPRGEIGSDYLHYHCAVLEALLLLKDWRDQGKLEEMCRALDEELGPL